MDSGEFNKIAGAVIGALLLFMLLGFFSEKIYHGEEHGEVLAYAVEIPEADGEAPAEEEAVDLAALVASAEPSEGEKLFRQCQACHKLEDGANAVGPHLWDVVGRDIASVSGFNYSDALASIEGEWDLEHLSAFLADPKGYAPGTKMAYGGMKDPQDRVNLIAWLNEIGGTPIELAAAPAETATDAAPEGEAAAEAEVPAEGEGAAAAPAEPAATEEAPAADAPAEGETAAAIEAAPATGGGMFANASAEEGEKVFRKCKACHVIDDTKNRVGPHLQGVVGRDIAAVEGFSYSDALASMEGEWTPEKLAAFLENPKGWAPGTKMAFGGLKDEADLANVIKYMNEAGGSNVPLE